MTTCHTLFDYFRIYDLSKPTRICLTLNVIHNCNYFILFDVAKQMKDDEQEPDEKTALIEQKQEDTPALLEKTGDDKPHRIEKTGEDKPPLIEKTGVDNDALIEQTAEDKSRLIKKAGEGIKKVLLFTYCRGGSSFLGSLFDTHPEAIYWYEGLAPFYRQYLWELGTAAFNIWFDIEAGHKVRYVSAFILLYCYTRCYVTNNNREIAI